MTYIDTNILIYLMEGHERYGRQVAAALENLATQNNSLVTSVITVTEFLAGTSLSSLSTLLEIPDLKFVALDEVLAEQAAGLLRKYPGLQIGDAVHVATAIQEQADLFFTNDKHLAEVITKHLKVKTL